MRETLEVLVGADLSSVGAGPGAIEAAAPVELPVDGGSRIVVPAFACPSSGVDRRWQATGNRMGVNFLDEDDEEAIAQAAERLGAFTRPGDIIICSIHWGPNWGYDIDPRHRAIAHAFIEAGADIVFGHSSHHPKAAEVYKERLVLYGCGDFLNDYEGIGPFDGHRSDLAVMYLPRVRGADGALEAMRLVPFRVVKFRLERVDIATAQDLHRRLRHEYARFGLPLDIDAEGTMSVEM